MSEQRKKILENLAETLNKIDAEGLKAIEIFSSGVAAVASAREEMKPEEEKKEDGKEES